jgi:hypothetical protein
LNLSAWRNSRNFIIVAYSLQLVLILAVPGSRLQFPLPVKKKAPSALGPAIMIMILSSEMDDDDDHYAGTLNGPIQVQCFCPSIFIQSE